MPKERGPYRQYFVDTEQPLPRSTYFLKKKAQQEGIKKSVEKLYGHYIIKQTTSTTKTKTVVPTDVASTEINDSFQSPSFTPLAEQLELRTESVTEKHNENSTDENDFSSFINFSKIEEGDRLELQAALLTLFFYGQMTQKCFNMMLKIFNAVLKDNKLPNTYNSLLSMMLKKTDQSFIDFEKRWYCEICHKLVVLDVFNQRSCKSCNSSLSMYYDLDMKSQIQRIFNKFSGILTSSQTYEHDYMSDIVDGKLYQDLLRNEVDGKLIKNRKAFTFLLNTDGIAVADKTRLTIWPIYLTINELPKDLRYCIDNVIIAGISVGDSKPNVDIYFEPIINKLQELQLGVKLNINDQVEKIKFFAIAGVFDKPARASLLNIVSSTGFNSCLKCLQTGESKPTQKGGSVRVYQFTPGSPKWPERTHEMYELHSRKAENDQAPCYGIKGRTCLSQLKHYKPTYSTCIDYMHSVLEGVMKSLFRYWFEGDSARAFSLRKFMQEIDNRLLLIKPPTFVTTSPRSIYIWNQWRAHEFLSFLLFYSIPVFYHLIPYELFLNLIKLVIFMEILLSPKILKTDLTTAQSIVESFVSELESLYDENIMLSGFHELVHLADATLVFGHLNSVNCFQFEELNRKFMSFIHGKDLIGEEFIKIFTACQSLAFISASLGQPNNEELYNFIKENVNFKTSNTKYNTKNQQDFHFLSSQKIISNLDILDLYNNFFGTNDIELAVYTRMKFRGHLYSSTTDDSRKHSDSCFISSSGLLGLIEFMFYKNGIVYVLAKQLFEPNHNPFFCPNSPQKKSFVSLCFSNDSFFIHKLEDIRKIMYIKAGENVFVSKFRYSHLFL